MNAPPLHPKRRALTLVELTVVIMILGILGALATPRFLGAVQSARLSGAARSLHANLRYVRNCAINRGRAAEVQFDSTNAHYLSPTVDHPDQPGRPLSVDLKSLFDPAIELSADFAGKSSVTFDLYGVPRVDGNPIESGQVNLSLGGQTATVVVRASGRVESVGTGTAGES